MSKKVPFRGCKRVNFRKTRAKNWEYCVSPGVYPQLPWLCQTCLWTPWRLKRQKKVSLLGFHTRHPKTTETYTNHYPRLDYMINLQLQSLMPASWREGNLNCYSTSQPTGLISLGFQPSTSQLWGRHLKARVNLEHYLRCDRAYFRPRCSTFWYFHACCWKCILRRITSSKNWQFSIAFTTRPP